MAEWGRGKWADAAEAAVVGVGTAVLMRVRTKANVKKQTKKRSHRRCEAPPCLWIEGWRTISFVLPLLFIFTFFREKWERRSDRGQWLSPIPLRIFPEFSQFLSNFSPISRWAIRCPSVYKRWRRCRWAQLDWGLRRWWRPTHKERPTPLYDVASSRVSVLVFSIYPPTMNSSKIQKKKKMPSKIS